FHVELAWRTHRLLFKTRKAISKYHKYRKDGAHGDCLNRSQVILESETNELCKDKYTGRTYRYQQTVIRYIWAKANESTSKHHHLILLFDRDLFQSLGTGREGWGRFLYKKVRNTWDRVVEAYYGQSCSGLAYCPTNEGFELFFDTESFPLQLNEFFYRISRLAKPIANRNDHFNKSFGCSHDSP
ncbi:YagK/YfjJ domain-containing protein, partial [Vibrio aestuarianus]|uniref:YagK/YfjJ domain-containing protein n=1 Tax=Vibrio aestuarianus TaxID=28171 RepID=UPI003BB0C28C